MIVPSIALLLLVATVSAADEATLLGQLGSGTAVERRDAAARLAEVGTSAATGPLARALRDTDAEVRAQAQAALWAIWHRSGDREVDALLAVGIAHMEDGRYPEAVDTFTRVIERDPGFAEGWNKRATAHYLMGEYDRSLADCREVVRRNPIHWGALAGFGLNLLKKGDLERALEYFERALAVNPNLEAIEAAADQIRELVMQRRRQAI